VSGTIVRLPPFDVTGGPTPLAAALRERIQDAAAHGTRLRVVGGGHWLDAGRPVRTDATLAVEGAGIVEYTPGDLTLTALAGTPLEDLERATRAERQWLPFDPFGSPRGTLGATVVTASAGPLAHAFGTPRDNVLGLEFVTGAGAVVRGGGRVVKNVAGFDLVRLLVGSWGSLAVVSEVTVRLRALPEADLTLALPLPGDVAAARALVARVVEAHRTTLAPVALELLSAPLARRLSIADGHVLLLRLAGNADLVRAQWTALAAMGDVAELPADRWGALRESEPEGAATVRLSHRPAHRFDVWLHALSLAERLPGAWVHASLGRGVARLVVPTADPSALAAAFTSASFAVGGEPGTRIFERLPSVLWPVLSPSALPPGTAGELMRKVKDAYDPHHLLNPGIMGIKLYGA
jgi:glycolate oxidase FAD binding subunit